MLGNKVISLCVAAFNAEKHIEKMIISIIKCKELDKIDLIIVNDGSTDTTAKIAEKYRIKHPEIIQLINKENGGSGSARNKAVEVAKGEYCRIMDADDFVIPEELDQFILKIEKYDVDLVLNGYYTKIVNEENYTHKSFCEGVLKPDTVYSFDSYNGQYPKFVKMYGVTYKTKLLQDNNIKLSEGVSYVDLEYITLPMSYVKNSVYIKHDFYVYQMGLQGQSMDPSVFIKKENQVRLIFQRLFNYLDTEKNKNEVKRINLLLLKAGVAQASAGLYNVFFLQERYDLKKEMVILDKYILQRDEDVWSYIAEISGSTKLMRLFDYQGYKIMVFIHKILSFRKGTKR